MGFFELFGHTTYVLIAGSSLVKDMLWLRVLLIVASLSSIVFNYTVPATPLWLVIHWNVVFVAIHVVRLGMLAWEKHKATHLELNEVAA